MTNTVFDALAEVVEIASDALEEQDATEELKRFVLGHPKPESITIAARDLALMGIGAKLDRLAEASERQATAMENLTGLLAAVIGLADSECSDGVGSAEFKPVAYVRTGDGIGSFNCDENAGPA